MRGGMALVQQGITYQLTRADIQGVSEMFTPFSVDTLSRDDAGGKADSRTEAEHSA